MIANRPLSEPPVEPWFNPTAVGLACLSGIVQNERPNMWRAENEEQQFLQNMNNKSHGKSRVIILRRVITLPGCGFSVMLVSILLCLMGYRVGAGILVATGDNGHGQLGNGTTTSTNKLSPVLGLGEVSAHATAASAAFAIRNGALYAWGYNSDGQLGDGTTIESHLPVPVSGLSNGVTAVTAGLRHGLALKNGIVYAWGYNGTGALGNGAFDYDAHATPAPVTGLTGVTAIAAGDYHSLALQNGAVYAWGWNDVGELGNGNSGMENLPVLVTGMNTGVTAIVAGSFFNLAIKDGALWGWGANYYSQLGTGVGSSPRRTPVPATNFSSGVTAIAAGNDHALAVKNGVVYAWGRNYAGELGNGGWSSIYEPLIVPGLPTNIVEVAAGYWSSYARSADGRLWAWGDGLQGQSGTGANFNYNTAQQVPPPAGYRFTSITSDASGHFAMATLAEPSGGVLLLSWSNGAPCLSIYADVGKRYALEYVSTLPPNNNWQRLATNTLTGNPWIVTDTSAAENATRFYRAVLLP
jgi:alpha-tubulin suppressor-like RCC1 family protein